LLQVVQVIQRLVDVGGGGEDGSPVTLHDLAPVVDVPTVDVGGVVVSARIGVTARGAQRNAAPFGGADCWRRPFYGVMSFTA